MILRMFAFTAAVALAQDPLPPVTVPVQAEPAVVIVTTPPLAPPDLNSPYASPRDAARHRLQVTLADLAANRNLKEAMRGFAQAFLDDRTYAPAALDLGIVAAIAEKWDDAVAALAEAARLDPGTIGVKVAPQLERLRLIAGLEKSREGQRKRRYEEALLPLLETLPSLSVAEADTALAAVGRLDPKRWEAPALLAGINGEGGGYQTAARFLEIAVANATDPAVKQALERALAAAKRELLYTSTRASAEAASDQGDYPKAAELYQTAWTAIPARTESGMDTVSALLLCDDTTHAAASLARLRQSGDPGAEAMATAMLKELATIEPSASTATSDAPQFFHEPGPREPVRIATLIPAVDRKPFEIYTRPLPKMAGDTEPVVLLASLAVDAPAGITLPALPAPVVAGENPWRELMAVRPRTENQPMPRAVQTADLSEGAAEPRSFQLSTEPAGARVFAPGSAEPACETPCSLRVTTAEYSLKLTLSGYRDAEQIIQAKVDLQDVVLPLEVLHGSVMMPATASQIKVNGTAIQEASPLELSLTPGLYRIGADFGSGYRERILNVKPAARLRLDPGSRREP